MDYAAKAQCYVHRPCLLEAAAQNPWREPIFSLIVELDLRCKVPGRTAITCKNGHRMTDDNVLLRQEHGREYRKCRTCERDRQRRGAKNRVEADRKRRLAQGVKAANWERTHCKNGHAYTPESIVTGRYGEKKCRECLKAAGRAAYVMRWGPRERQEPASDHGAAS